MATKIASGKHYVHYSLTAVDASGTNSSETFNTSLYNSISVQIVHILIKRGNIENGL